MENIGKCLQFYLKYPAEMERLLTEGLEKEGLRDPDAVLKKINAVSAKANQEAAEFLEKCAQGIEGHFEKIGYPVQRSRNNLEKDWELIFKIGSKGGLWTDAFGLEWLSSQPHHL